MPRGWGAFAGVKFTGAIYKPKRPSKGGFDEGTEKYDEKIFNEQVTPVAPVDETMPEPPPEPEKKAPGKKKKPKADWNKDKKKGGRELPRYMTGGQPQSLSQNPFEKKS